MTKKQVEIKLNDNQVHFFQQIARNDIVVDSGTWRSGKSFELCVFVKERMHKYPGIREFVGRKTLKSLKETTFLKFQEVLQMHYFLIEGRDYKVNRSSNPTITFPNGSICVFGDLDINTIGKWLSAEYSDICVDEAQEISQLVFEKIKSRQTQTIIQKLSNGKQKNKFIMAMNPPESAERHWMHGKFRNPETAIPNSKIIYSKIEANSANIPDSYIEDMHNSVDDRTAEIYLKGNWVPMLSKLVFPDYDFPQDEMGKYIEGGNLKHLSVSQRLENYISIDYGWTHPMSIGCWQYDRHRGIFYRLYEMVENHVKPETYCALLTGEKLNINGKEYQLPITVYDSTIVPLIEATQKRQESGGRSNLMIMMEIFKNLGVPFNYRLASERGIHKGLLAVRRLIKTSTDERKIFIDPRYCKRFIQDAKSYHYPTDKEGNVVGEEPKKDDISDHTQDEARGLIAMLHPIRGAESRAYGV
jgi:phage terminase large subunit